MLTAVDAAVMLIDAAKGLEPQTLKLFQVCKHNGLPIITVINKWDRPGRAPLELLDEITEQIGLVPTPLFMPVGIAGDYRGLLRRGEDGAPEEYIHFIRTAGGSTIAPEEIYTPDAALEREGEVWETAVRIRAAVGDKQDHDQGCTWPVRQLSSPRRCQLRCVQIRRLVELVPPPREWPTVAGGRGDHRPVLFMVFRCRPEWTPPTATGWRSCAFSGRVRARHGGAARADEQALHHQGAHRVRPRPTRRDRHRDVVGLVNATGLAPRDTSTPVGKVVPADPAVRPRVLRGGARAVVGHKQFRKAIDQLAAEGVVQILRNAPAATPTR